MIPKVIHYCWFGRNPLPELAERCIASWRKFFPDYEIKEWNEDNFDVSIIPYTRDAYEAKKYAFVSDYARFWILYHFGGLYFDTDVEVIKPMEDLISLGSFMGFEFLSNKGNCAVNPGLGMCAVPGLDLYREVLNGFGALSFWNMDGIVNNYSMIPLVTEILMGKGLKGDGRVEMVSGVYFYPPDYFNPFDDATGRLKKTENTRTIHWFMKSWLPKEPALLVLGKRLVRRLLSAIGLRK